MTIKEIILEAINAYYNNITIECISNNNNFYKYDITFPIGMYIYYYIINNYYKELDAKNCSASGLYFRLYHANTLSDVLKYIEKYHE